jgi:hypothetical protein
VDMGWGIYSAALLAKAPKIKKRPKSNKKRIESSQKSNKN